MMKIKNQKSKIKNCLCFLLLLGIIAGCDNYERKGTVTPEITVNEPSLTLFIGETAQLKAAPTELSFSWLSEDTEVATVDGNGLVMATGEGSTFIVARSGEMSRRVPVTSLTKIPLIGFSLNATSIDATPGTKTELWVILDPPNANDASLPEWCSLDKNIATVDYKGVITGVDPGVTDVVCSINGIERTVSVEIWVTKPFRGPHTLSVNAPYTLKAADFDYGGRGNSWRDNNNNDNQAGSAGINYRIQNGDNNARSVGIEGAGNNIGYTEANEWLVYTINVADAGDYKVEAEIACNGNSRYSIELDGVYEGGFWKDWISVFNSPLYTSTGGWGSYVWKTENDHVLTLTEGEHRIRFVFGNPTAFNFRNLKFTYIDPNAIDPNVPFVSDELNPEKHATSVEISGETFSKMFFTLEKDREYTLFGGLADAEVIFNLDFFDRVSANKVKFLGENGDYKLYYSPTQKTVILTVDVTNYPGYLVGMGKGFAYPGKISPMYATGYPQNGTSSQINQYVLYRRIGNNMYQTTVMLKGGSGNLEFKGYHAAGGGNLTNNWGNGGEYRYEFCTFSGVANVFAGANDGNNWIAGSGLDESSLYRVTFTITEEKKSADVKVEKVDWNGTVVP